MNFPRKAIEEALGFLTHMRLLFGLSLSARVAWFDSRHEGLSHMIYSDLKQRGLVYQATTEEMAGVLAEPQSFYCGFDPTSDSLHIGSLLPLLVSRRLQAAGHKPYLLIGGATGMIGDPSGKSEERNLITPETIAHNVNGIRKIFEKFMDFDGENGAVIVNNMDWMGEFSYIQFLRDVGKHFSVNTMLAKDSVKGRLENRDQGISYTEFSYMLLQSYDFYHLHKTQGCNLQIGGSDQWGNITAGVDLIRRMQGQEHDKDVAYGLTFPLVTKSNGQKFGKTEAGNVWLSADKTSPYQFYQFFLRLGDEDIVTMVKIFSLKPWEDIEELLQKSAAEPHLRLAQKALAEELTVLVHGADEFQRVFAASQALFSGDLGQMDKKTLLEVFEDVPSLALPSADVAAKSLVDLLVESGLCSSKGAARKDLKAGAISQNNVKLAWEGSDDPRVKSSDLLHDSLLVLRRGKKSYGLIRFEK